MSCAVCETVFIECLQRLSDPSRCEAGLLETYLLGVPLQQVMFTASFLLTTQPLSYVYFFLNVFKRNFVEILLNNLAFFFKYVTCLYLRKLFFCMYHCHVLFPQIFCLKFFRSVRGTCGINSYVQTLYKCRFSFP